MNKIVREHYPASKLPPELRGSIAAGASVTVTIEEEPDKSSRKELLELLEKARSEAKGVTIQEAVKRVRDLRDEWDN